MGGGAEGAGPYIGLLDLPGGSPEPGESEVETLRRELREECGVDLTQVIERVGFSFRVDRDSVGRPIDFVHSGVMFQVAVAGEVVSDIAAEDVRGVLFAGAADEGSFSPLVREALRHFGDAKDRT